MHFVSKGLFTLEVQLTLRVKFELKVHFILKVNKSNWKQAIVYIINPLQSFLSLLGGTSNSGGTSNITKKKLEAFSIT